jgi:hypothetical protein
MAQRNANSVLGQKGKSDCENRVDLNFEKCCIQPGFKNLRVQFLRKYFPIEKLFQKLFRLYCFDHHSVFRSEILYLFV